MVKPNTVTIADSRLGQFIESFKIIDFGPQQRRGFATAVPHVWRIIYEADVVGRPDALDGIMTLLSNPRNLSLLEQAEQRSLK